MGGAAMLRADWPPSRAISVLLSRDPTRMKVRNDGHNRVWQFQFQCQLIIKSRVSADWGKSRAGFTKQTLQRQTRKRCPMRSEKQSCCIANYYLSASAGTLAARFLTCPLHPDVDNLSHSATCDRIPPPDETDRYSEWKDRSCTQTT
ncbi:hypothetical protein XELAEV_18045181mg [Xenopus laevis]|uniref:Uncharacterized protein n=1 Tax=Xenopus laevis TaxID=8355 RepID=A0A974C006_XENLA|nr:hypothetical protein XELAEV_18045181mg [Xenopus laevis]